MAEEIVIKTKLDLSQAERELREFGGKVERTMNQPRAALGGFTKDANAASLGINSLRFAVNPLTAAFAALAAVAIAAGAALKKFAEISIQAAIDVNKQVNVLKALTGSAEAAEKRFAALFALAQKTPGLTTNLAATLDAQLRVFSVAERTIDRLLPVIGRLNAISPIGDPRQFVNNFTQLISQNFERQDLKELVGQSPIAGLLIKEIFNVDNPTNAEAIRTAAKRLGITTVERLAEEFADAAATNSALRNATESFAGQLEKLQDRITVALAPVGEEILRTLLPAFREFVDLLERDLPKITALLRDNRDEFLAVASAVVEVADAVGQLIGKLAQINQQFGIIQALSILGLSVTSPGSTGAILNFFDRQNQQSALIGALDPFERLRFARARGDKSLEPSRAELLEFAQGQGRLDLFSQIPPEPKPPPVRPPPTGGGGGGAVSAAQREREREIKDLIRKQSQSLEERREQDFKDFDDLNRLLQVGLVEEESRLRGVAGRPAQLAAFNAAQAERIRQIDIESATLSQNTAEKAAKELAKLPPILSDSERFMQGFADATLSAGDAFEQFGNDVARAFTNVRDLFGSLKRAVLDFFNNLLGSALQNLVRGTLGSLFGGGGGGGGLGNLFRAPSFAQAFGGGGISAPSSVSSSIVGSVGGSAIDSFFGAGVPRTAGSVRGGFSFGALGSSLAAAAPLLGLPLGVGLGGRSTAGQILGGAGGALAGAGLLFANPLTAIAGVGLLIGGALFGRAKQRRSDEEASGQFLLQAQAGIDQLAAAVASGQITTLAEARGLFDSQILGTFRQQIGSLKTKSVRESRLTNQVRDLRNLFEARIPPLIAEQERRAAEQRLFAANDRRLIPEFAGSGFVPGIDRGRDSVLAMMTPGELVLNKTHQAGVRAIAGPDVFDRVGVPRTAMQSGGAQAFQNSGFVQPSGHSGITLFVQVGMSQSGAEEITAAAFDSSTGQRLIVDAVQRARLDKEL